MAYIYKSKSKKSGKEHDCWRYQYRDYTGRKRTATGTTSKQETLKIARDVEARHRMIRRGDLPKPQMADATLLFDTVRKEYLALGEKRGGHGGRPWSRAHYNNSKRSLAFWETKLKLQYLIELMDCRAKVEHALASGAIGDLSPKSTQAHIDRLSAFCTWCAKKSRGYLPENPLADLERMRTTPQVKRRALTQAECLTLLAACRPERRVLYAVAMLTGLRAKELASLRVRDFDSKHGMLRLAGEFTKNGRDAFQPLGTDLVELLEADLVGKDSDDRLLHVPSHPARELAKDLESAKIPRETHEGVVVFHSLRNSFVSLLVEDAQATPGQAQHLARHSTLDLTMRVYNRVRQDSVRAAVQKIGELVLGQPDASTGADSESDDHCESTEPEAPQSAPMKVAVGQTSSIPAASNNPLQISQRPVTP